MVVVNAYIHTLGVAECFGCGLHGTDESVHLSLLHSAPPFHHVSPDILHCRHQNATSTHEGDGRTRSGTQRVASYMYFYTLCVQVLA